METALNKTTRTAKKRNIMNLTEEKQTTESFKMEPENLNEIDDKNIDINENTLQATENEIGTIQPSSIDYYTPTVTMKAQQPASISPAAVNKVNTQDTKLDNSSTHSSDRRHSCEICKIEFKCKGLLKAHLLVHTEERPYFHSICNKERDIQFEKKSHMITYMNKAIHSQLLYHPGNASIECHHYGQRSPLLQYLLEHNSDSHLDSNCNICNRKFRLNTDLDSHMAAQHSQYLCGICNKECASQSVLERHVFTHSKEKRFTCSVCNKKYSSKSSLRIHMYSHTGEVKYICSVCGKIFTSKNILNNHMYTHTNEKCCSCEVCFKTFSNSCALKAHMKVHTGEKPYTCKECDNTFTHKHNLQSHMLVHSGERNHVCSVCERRFARKPDLNMHMLVHTGEKKHKCTICDKAFKRRENLRMHIESHARLKDYICTICNKQYKLLPCFKRHMLKHTENQRSRTKSISA